MFGRAFVGTLLVLLGFGLALDAAGRIEFGEVVSTWWPIILIIAGATMIATSPQRPLVGIFLVILGGLFLAAELGYLPQNWGLFVWPALLMLAGVAILRGRGAGRHRTRGGHGWQQVHDSDDDSLKARAIFSGINERVRSQNFRGGAVEAVFGGVQLDLRDAKLAPEGARLSANATCGGIEILVPPGWNVEVKGRPILGGIDNHTTPGLSAISPTLRIDATATLGGVEVRN